MTNKENFQPETHKTELINQIKDLNAFLAYKMNQEYSRSLPVSELYNDRWEKAVRLGFGEETNIYDQSYVFGDVQVGTKCWIGMNTILDGSGGLIIGNECTISAGVQIYTHDNLLATLSPQYYTIAREKVVIGNNCYIGPLSIISKGVIIGHHSIVAANSFVKKSFPEFSIIAGTPARQIGIVNLCDHEITFEYFKT